MLVDPTAINAYRAGQLSSESDPKLRAFAARVPELLAEAAAETFKTIQGPHKRSCAGVLAACWYAGTVALLDAIRAEGVDVSDPSELPAQIAHFRAI